MANSWFNRVLSKMGLVRDEIDSEYDVGEDISHAEPERGYAQARQPRPRPNVEQPREQIMGQPRPRPMRNERPESAESLQYTSRRGEDNMVDISSMRTMGFAQPEQKQHTIIYYLREFEDCKDVIDDLIEKKTILLNLEDMDEIINQRAIDMLSGAAYALDATLKRAAKATYLIAPKNVDVEDSKETQSMRYGSSSMLRSIK